MEELTYCDKPSRNESYFKNIQLKVKTQKLVQRSGQTVLMDKWKNWNFKKNTGFKPLYSCYGYGGQCGSCRDSRGREDQSATNKKIVKQDLKEWKLSSSSD